jgi:hypothetical protein
MFGLKGPDWVIVALLAGSFVSDTDTLPQRLKSLEKAVKEYDRLSVQAKEALGRAMKSLEAEEGQAAGLLAEEKERQESDSLTLVDLAHRLGMKTEGRTAEEIADQIALMAVNAARSV